MKSRFVCFYRLPTGKTVDFLHLFCFSCGQTQQGLILAACNRISHQLLFYGLLCVSGVPWRRVLPYATFLQAFHKQSISFQLKNSHCHRFETELCFPFSRESFSPFSPYWDDVENIRLHDQRDKKLLNWCWTSFSVNKQKREKKGPSSAITSP